MYLMSGKTVLITGGTRGIGAVTAKAFLEKGYRVVSNYVHDDVAAQSFRNETSIPIYKWDVADPHACMAGVRKILDEIGAIDVLVNNAGITRDHTLQKMTIEEWKAVIDTDLSSCFYMCRTVIDSMKMKGFGRIINLSSIVGVTGQFGQTNYSAAKAGVIGLTKSLALETASKGITVNAIEPGFIKTEMLSTIPEETLKAIVERIPVKRLGHPEEIARAILFLADEESGFITGETLAVNGGMHMG
jgi:acetoacetyl-CoA reductase